MSPSASRLAAAGAILLAVGCRDTPQLVEPGTPSFTRAAQLVDVVVVLHEAYAPGGHVANQGRAAEIAGELGATATRTYGTALFGFAAAVPEGRIAALARDPRVAYVQRERVFQVGALVQGRPGGGGGGGQVVPWGVERIGADDNTNEGDGIHVYVIDTGIDSDHADLQANLGNGEVFMSCKGGPRTCKQPWDDDHGHGTHVSGTVGAINNDLAVLGVASKVTLHAVKVCDISGFCDGSAIIAGIDWMTKEVKARRQAAAANMSLGGGGSKTGTCNDNGTFTGSDAEHQAMCNARHAGVVFAVAAGNAGADAENTVPAAFDDVAMAVSALQCSVSNNVCARGTEDWPDWSNWGDNAASWLVNNNNSAPVAITAPGVSVLSLWNDGGTNTISGTSMATPHVAGTVALFLKSKRQRADGSAFLNARKALLTAAETTPFNNTSGNPHNEDLVNATSQ
jgi:subtilisin